jgi:hypothetical protein
MGYGRGGSSKAIIKTILDEIDAPSGEIDQRAAAQIMKLYNDLPP